MKAISCLALLLSVALIGREAPPALRAVRLEGGLQLDGRLDEPAWSRALPASGFTVSWPQFGKEAELATEVRVLYDERNLYVGARMHHPAGRAAVVGRVHRRDQDSASDWFGFYVDSLRDRRTAFAFLVNASGVQRDLIYTGDSASGDSTWDSVWESAVSVDADGWSAELIIPLSILRLKGEGASQVWGVNFSRSDSGPVRETSFWELAPREVNAFASRFPDLTGIEGIHPQPRREWIPFVSAQRKFETTQAHDDRGWKRDAGLDAHLGLGPSSQLDLSLRPDFGQVEVDQAVLNLGTYETFFPEKRPFFLEGMEIFQVPGPALFYSRRIGRSLSDPDLPEGTTLLQRPQTADIAAAAKYTAKFDTGTSVGVLGAGVQAAQGLVQEGDAAPRSQEISPSAKYGVLRVLQTLDQAGSYLGAFGSQAREAGPQGRRAQVGSLDGVLKTPDRSLLLEASLSHSEAGLPGDLATGYRNRLRINKRWSGGFTLEVQNIHSSHTYDPNDLGALSRSDEHIDYLYAEKVWDRTWGVLRNWQWEASYNRARDHTGRAYDEEWNTWARTDFVTFFSLFGGLGASLPRYDDRELRTFKDPVKKYLRYDRSTWANLGFDTPGNRPWYVKVQTWRTWSDGGPSQETDVYQSLKPTSNLEIQLDTFFARYEGDLRYLETRDGVPVVGMRRLSQVNQTVRVAYAFTPRLTLQLFTQLMAANWSFRDLKAYVDDDTLAPARDGGPMSQSDRLWNVNVIARWEFRPGSTAYLVYLHGAATDALLNGRATLSPRRDLGLLRHLPSDDAFQMKVSFLLR